MIGGVFGMALVRPDGSVGDLGIHYQKQSFSRKTSESSIRAKVLSIYTLWDHSAVLNHVYCGGDNDSVFPLCPRFPGICSWWHEVVHSSPH